MREKTAKHTCAVPQCKNRKNHPSKLISFHQFPIRDTQLSIKWQKALKISKPISKWTQVCSAHFTEKDFFRASSATTRKRLKLGVVPSQNLPKLPLNPTNDETANSTGSKTDISSVTINKESCYSNLNQSDLSNSDVDESKIPEFEKDNKYEVIYVNTEADDKENDDDMESNNTDDPMNKQDLLEFKQQCRICLETENLTILSKCQSLVDLFKSITKIKVKVRDFLPKYFCIGCIKKLEDISLFVEKARKIDAELRQTMSIHKELETNFQNAKDEALNGDIDIESDDSSTFSDMSSDEDLSDCISLSSESSSYDTAFQSGLFMDSEVYSSVENKNAKSKSIKSDEQKEKKGDHKCWKCGILYRGITLPKYLSCVPKNKIRFQCIHCSNKSEGKGNSLIKNSDETNIYNSDHSYTSLPEKSKSFKRLRVYPGKRLPPKNEQATRNMPRTRRIRCTICSKSIPITNYLSHHLMKHKGDKKFDCTKCSASFSHPAILRQHVNKHS